MHLQHVHRPLPVAVFTASSVPGPGPLSAFVVLALAHAPTLVPGCDSSALRIGHTFLAALFPGGLPASGQSAPPQSAVKGEEGW
jgi:hypothetical protein